MQADNSPTPRRMAGDGPRAVPGLPIVTWPPTSHRSDGAALCEPTPYSVLTAESRRTAPALCSRRSGSAGLLPAAGRRMALVTDAVLLRVGMAHPSHTSQMPAPPVPANPCEADRPVPP